MPVQDQRSKSQGLEKQMRSNLRDFSNDRDLELLTGLVITIDLKLNNQLISLVLLNNLEQPPLEPHTLESFTIGCNPMQNSTNHGAIKLSPTVQAALKPRQVPSASKEDLRQLAKTCVTTLICKTFSL